ncbi:MAG: thioredoxin domain-containing protein [Syntrophales bacterium LBB04]|nr:thioredoxin domain-containing protein [Syntrophales bacterium LBB04]
MGIILIYTFCSESCRYLSGSILGVDLKYLGILLLIAIFTLNLFKKEIFCIALLSTAIGGEIFLIGYQVVKGVYCPYCLAFGVTLILMFLVNFNKTILPLIVLLILLGFAFFLFSFSGSTTPAFAEDGFITSFGSGPVEVRLYTDYFCDPCRAAEPEIKSLITNLMYNNTLRFTFIDTPVHKETTLYAKYFLFLLNGKERSLSNALMARSALYEAAGLHINSNASLEAFLLKKNFLFKPLDTAPIFQSLEKIIKDDGINSTPSCVITEKGNKKRLVGGPNIIKELKTILDTERQKQHP